MDASVPVSVDLHILLSEDGDLDWRKQALDSIDVAVARAPFPVHVHVLPAVPGHLGQARTLGYSQGTAPYVTYADDDDYLLPEAFEVVADALSQRPLAVFPFEHHLQNGYITRGLQRHHLPFYRRDMLVDQRDQYVCGDVINVQRFANAAPPSVIDVTTPVYVHRLYAHSRSRVLRRQHTEEYRRAARPWSHVDTPPDEAAHS